MGGGLSGTAMELDVSDSRHTISGGVNSFRRTFTCCFSIIIIKFTFLVKHQIMTKLSQQVVAIAHGQSAHLPRLFVPTELVVNASFAGLLSGIIIAYPAHCILPAFATLWMLGSP